MSGLPLNVNEKEIKKIEKEGKIKKVTATQQKQLFRRTKAEQMNKNVQESKNMSSEHFKERFQ
jgi:plasmid maintenance system killer protein